SGMSETDVRGELGVRDGRAVFPAIRGALCAHQAVPVEGGLQIEIRLVRRRRALDEALNLLEERDRVLRFEVGGSEKGALERVYLGGREPLRARVGEKSGP